MSIRAALRGASCRLTRRPRAPHALVVGSVAVAAVVAWSAWLEPRRLVKRCETITLPRWPDALDGLRVGVIADLHAGSPPVDERRVGRVVDALDALGADLVLVTGDLVDADSPLGGSVPPEAVGARLRELRAPLGAFGVLGNHDWAFDGRRVIDAAERAGIRVLENEVAPVERDGARLWVAGFADASSRSPLIARALERVPADGAILAVTHSPDVFPAVPARVSLTVAGHTHAGQVNLPLVRRLTIPSRFGDRYAEGHIEEGGRHLFVARGLGTSKLPLRLLAPPQVTVLELRADARV